MVVHLNPQVLEHGHAFGIRNGVYRLTDLFDSEACMCTVIGDRNRAKRLFNIRNTLGVLIDPSCCIALVLNEHGHHRCQHPCIGAGLHSQVNIGHFRRLGDHRIDDNHGLTRILRKIAQKYTRSGYTVRLPGVLT